MEVAGAVQSHLFVDEAGDLTLFNKKGKILVGEEGVSRYFMIGAAFLPDPKSAAEMLDQLRNRLLKIRYFDVPSMRPEGKKTAVAFHACKDLAEVRWEVFQLLRTLRPRVTVAIRRKQALAENAIRTLRDTGKRINPNDFYDDLVEATFRQLLHSEAEHRIVYAIRGKNPRAEAFERSISRAKLAIGDQQGEPCRAKTKIQPALGSEFAGLQIVDYYLWAVQRLYEKSEDRFFRYVEDDYATILDLDDCRNSPLGEYYGPGNVLEIRKINP